MLCTTEPFLGERAPCGKLRGGTRHREDDEEGLVIDNLHYDCGCRRIRREFHDGSVRIRVIRHDGKVLADEHSGDHEA
ncbi:hypothetical protein APR12_004662 [Nocardia amikacinitolerans]|uniref:fumarate reductase n=1 Tax=Nocardia amikacinitolerans TaxID=756689 RepID=UPI0008376D33|nr:fumarate reductase [Nocardia amikacinitolerans]MCP2319295.1 hypothetical protein [Nocardia amikacinitolerans]